MLNSKISEFRSNSNYGTNGHIDAIILGDFNCEPGSIPYKILTSQPNDKYEHIECPEFGIQDFDANFRLSFPSNNIRLRDTRLVASNEPEAPPIPTWCGFDQKGPNKLVDYVLISEGIQVIKYEVINFQEQVNKENDTYAQQLVMPSHHRPLMVDLSL
jgi:endonuclease/exonuclease/phosphatase family metal-dependent hydrolase